MMNNAINLEIYLPDKVFLRQQDVRSLVAEGPAGYIGLLPNRLDCVLPLVAGILSFVIPAGTRYVAIDEGILVKTGADVRLSVRHAAEGAGLGDLEQTVKQEFRRIDSGERQLRAVVSQLESGFIRQFLKMHQR
jgi:F-type H+-transporting ATPase subunit epsilon